MKKKIIFVFIIIINITLFTPNAFSKVYKIGFTEDYYPYISINKNGNPEGIIIDWWSLWSLKSGVKIEFVPMDTQSSIEQIKSGKIDIIAGLFYSDERAEYLDFSESILRMRTVVYLKNKAKVDSIQNIKCSIGLVENDIPHRYFTEYYPEIKLITFKTNALLLNAVYEKSIEGFVYDVPNPIGKYKEITPPDGYIVFKTLFTERLRPAVKKGNSKLLSLITSGATKISDEELFEIASKWNFLEEDRTIMWWALSFGALLILVILFLLNKSVKNKRKKELLISYESETDWQAIIGSFHKVVD